MPTISVIVPVYKVEDYLSDCIDSILAQTFKDFELILVDDGSPDNCGKICDEYKEKDDRIVVIHKENGGLSDARNKGIEIAKGEYLTFVDSDDLLHNDYLRILFDNAKSVKAEISICSMEKFSDGVSPNLEHMFPDSSEKIVLTGKEACKNLMTITGYISVVACAKLYKAAIFKSLRFPINRINEDNGTTPIALYNADQAVYTSASLYKYRQRASSIMNQRFTPRKFDLLYCLQICIDYFEKQNDIELVNQAKTIYDIELARLIIDAISSHSFSLVPMEYKISIIRALTILRKNLPNDSYCWQLAKINPKLVIIHEYIRKIRKVLNIKR